MKKYYKIFLCAAFVSAFIAIGCSDDDTDPKEGVYGEQISIDVTLLPTVDGLNFQFSENDKISAYDSKGWRVGELTLNAGSTGKSAGGFVSAGNLVLNDGETYTFVYPAQSSLRYEATSYYSASGVQVGEGNGHLTQMGRFEGQSVYDSGAALSVDLETNSSFVKFKIAKPDADYTPASDGILAGIKVEITDISTEGNFYSTSEVRIEELADWNDPVAVYAAMSPLSSGFERTMKVIATTTQGKSFEITTDPEKDKYAPATQHEKNISGLSYTVPELVDAQLDVRIANDVRQEVYYGIDAERLWYWQDAMRDELAKLGVGDINARYARVVIDGAYELEEGKKNPACYDVVINLMKAFKAANPNIEFFATPRPIFNSYTAEERIAKFGHVDNTPWSSVPLWVYSFVQDGTKTMPDGTVVPKWKDGELNKENMLRYFSDYLNLMHANGLEITYMDLTNEKEYASPEIHKFFCDNLPSKLNEGVHMPKVIGPSSWDFKTASNWLKRVQPDEVASLGAATTHNTGDLGGTIADFVAAAHALRPDMPVWNNELHGWTGIEIEDEILNSEVFWQHIQGGFNSVMSWLFYGPKNGKDHTMLWVDGTSSNHIKSAKYEIFKKTVNNTADGNYLACTLEGNSTDMLVTPFIRDKKISIAVLNKSGKSRVLTFDLSEREIAGGIQMTRWNSSLPRSGVEAMLWPQRPGLFQCAISAKSLYFFTLELK